VDQLGIRIARIRALIWIMEGIGSSGSFLHNDIMEAVKSIFKVPPP
jgi:hypothetical protein